MNEQLGVTYTGGIQFWPEYISSFKYVKESLDTKIKKLQTGNYKQFENYEIFIFTDTWMYETILNEMERYCVAGNVFKYFNRLYVLEKGFKLHIFEENKYQKVIIDVAEQTERNIRARRMVEEAEEQE